MSIIKDLAERLKDLQQCHEKISKRGTLLTRAQTELESLKATDPNITTKIEKFCECASTFRIGANGMITVSKFIII